MPNRKIQVDIFANPEGFKKGTSEAAQSASWLEKALGRLGPVGNLLQGTLNRVGLSSISMGAGLTGGAVVALGAAYEVGKRAIDQYVALGESIRNYSILTGQSAEASSRQVQAFQVLGVSEEDAAAGAVKLSKAIEKEPKHLEALGIAIARDAQGNVDLGKTLLNVASAYQSTGDAARKNEIMLAAFGKAGATMMPILNANAAELKRLEDTVGKVYTADDLKRVHDYEIAQKGLKRSTDELGLNLGQALLPAWKANIDTINENIYVNQHLDERVQHLTGSHGSSRAALAEAGKELRAEYHAAQDAATAADTLAAAQQNAANAALAEAAAEDAAVKSIEGVQSASFAATHAYLAVGNAQQKVTDAQKAYNDAVKQYGANSAQAQQLNRDLNAVLIDQEDAIVKAGLAAKALYEEQQKAAGAAPDVVAATQAEIAELESIAATLSPGSPLRKYLDAYIAQLKTIPGEVTTNIAIAKEDKRAAGGHGALAFDEGGIVPGPVGRAVPAIVHGGEVVLTPEQQAASRSPVNITIHVYGNSDPTATAKLVAQRLRNAFIG